MKTAVRQDLLREIKGLSPNLAKDVLNFVVFVKYKNVVDADQSYFWSKKWQKLEKEAGKEIKAGKTHRYSSLKGFKTRMGD